MDEHSKKILAVRQLLKERDEARMNSDFEKSDFLREKLSTQYGVVVIDQKGGPSGWKFIDGSSIKLKPGLSIPPTEATAKTEGKKRKVESNIETAIPSPKKIKKDKPEAKSQITKTTTKPAPTVVSGEQKRNSEVLTSLLGTSTSSSSSSTTVQGVLIEDTKPGSGPVAVVGNRVAVNYVGKLKSNGKVFDASKKKPFIFRLGRGEVIKGWDIGVAGMAVGGARRLTIPPEKAYGRQGSPPVIPPNAALVFDVTLCKIL